MGSVLKKCVKNFTNQHVTKLQHFFDTNVLLTEIDSTENLKREEVILEYVTGKFL